MNGRIVAEQIGAQIFIDSWAMVAPGNPKLAFELAGKAASVSHDGEAVLAAQLLAVMEAQAFVESDINALFELGLLFLPKDSLVARLATEPGVWRFSSIVWSNIRRFESGHELWSQSKGTGLFVMGGGDWRDYVVTSTLRLRLGRSFGLAARVRGLRRYYAFVLTVEESARIVRRFGETILLGETEFRWEFERPYELKLEVCGTEIAGSVDGKGVLRVTDEAPGVDAGGFGFVCEEGLLSSDALEVKPA